MCFTVVKIQQFYRAGQQHIYAPKPAEELLKVCKISCTYLSLLAEQLHVLQQYSQLYRQSTCRFIYRHTCLIFVLHSQLVSYIHAHCTLLQLEIHIQLAIARQKRDLFQGCQKTVWHIFWLDQLQLPDFRCICLCIASQLSIR